MTVSESWASICEWHKKNVPFELFRPNPGASEAELLALQKHLGFDLPLDFWQFYQIVNGLDSMYFLEFGRLLGLERLRFKWESFIPKLESYNWFFRRSRKPHNPALKPLMTSKRVAFLDHESGDYVFLDCDPGSAGSYGQILYHSRENGPERILGASLEQWLDAVAHDLNNGLYYYEPECECVLSIDNHDYR